MSFAMPTTTTAPAAGGFSFGLQTSTAGAKPSNFSFGTTPQNTAAAKPPTFGVPATVAATPAPTFGSGFGTIPAAVSAPATATLPTLSGFGTTSTPAPAFGITPQNAATAAKPIASAAPTLTLGAPASTAATKPTLPVLTGFGTGSTASTLGLGVATTSAPSTSGFANLTTATKTTDSSSIATASQMTFNQLEEQINKWTLELEEQEKVFTEQATQINAWDKVLINNNQKILELNDAVQKVKNDQQMLEQELEFIATQHNELEDSIAPLQKEFSKIPQVDVERSQTYLMVENLDTQLKQMSEDLKEIIDNLNEANKGQDSSDPIIQIGKILNAHMSSLQWIETSSGNILNKLDDIDKMHESFKRDSERSFRSAYYN